MSLTSLEDGRNRNLHEFLISSDCGVKSPEAESPYASMAKQMTEDVIELTQDFLEQKNRGIYYVPHENVRKDWSSNQNFFEGIS